MIHNRFIDSPDADKVIILSEDDMAIWKVLQLHHEARAAGFSKVNFVKLRKDKDTYKRRTTKKGGYSR